MRAPAQTKKKNSSLTKDFNKLIAALEVEEKKIAACRDKLRNIQDDVESLASSCDEALDHLEATIDTLSQYV